MFSARSNFLFVAGAFENAVRFFFARGFGAGLQWRSGRFFGFG